MRRFLVAGIILACSACVAVGDSHAGWNPFKKDKGEKEKPSKVPETISRFVEKDPDLKDWFSKAYGYAVFPTVGKGGIGIGGAYGKGEVFEKGQLIGRTSLKQVTVGFQLGGQSYSEIIFFINKKALDDFTGGRYEFDAQVSAVAATAGASRDAAYSKGVAVFTLAKGGLMYEASVGGQKFTFKPIEAAE